MAADLNFTSARPPDIDEQLIGCAADYQELIQVKLSNTFVALSVILLAIINVMVIAGNILGEFKCHSHLHTCHVRMLSLSIPLSPT